MQNTNWRQQRGNQKSYIDEGQDNTMAKNEMVKKTNNDLKYTTQKTKGWVKRTSQKNYGWTQVFRKSKQWSTSDTW
jgi:hypothetical protein